MSVTTDPRRFGGVGRLFGEEGARRLAGAHVAVVGLGGVGSWVVEALVRTSVGRITLIDGDDVALSNTNRQLPAFEGAYGRAKAEVLRERCLLINPDCRIEVKTVFVTPENRRRSFRPTATGSSTASTTSRERPRCMRRPAAWA